MVAMDVIMEDNLHILEQWIIAIKLCIFNFFCLRHPRSYLLKFNDAQNLLGHTLLRHTFLFIVYLISERINIHAYKKSLLNLLNKNYLRIVSFGYSNK